MSTRTECTIEGPIDFGHGPPVTRVTIKGPGDMLIAYLSPEGLTALLEAARAARVDIATAAQSGRPFTGSGEA